MTSGSWNKAKQQYINKAKNPDHNEDMTTFYGAIKENEESKLGERANLPLSRRYERYRAA